MSMRAAELGTPNTLLHYALSRVSLLWLAGQVIRAAREAAQAANPGAVAEGSENTSSS
jgi:hypothetical protein